MVSNRQIQVVTKILKIFHTNTKVKNVQTLVNLNLISIYLILTSKIITAAYESVDETEHINHLLYMVIKFSVFLAACHFHVLWALVSVPFVLCWQFFYRMHCCLCATVALTSILQLLDKVPKNVPIILRLYSVLGVSYRMVIVLNVQIIQSGFLVESASQ